ncbi:MAG: hypothetical protein JO356_19835 [Acidobacteria bacterium]|nr:hypothetical protein [Acidobacteriota bacterium]
METQKPSSQLTLHPGAIYEDRGKNIVRLVSVDRHYCAYVVLPRAKSQMHGVITGFTKRECFQRTFVWVARSEADWFPVPELRLKQCVTIQPRRPSDCHAA